MDEDEFPFMEDGQHARNLRAKTEEQAPYVDASGEPFGSKGSPLYSPTEAAPSPTEEVIEEWIKAEDIKKEQTEPQYSEPPPGLHSEDEEMPGEKEKNNLVEKEEHPLMTSQASEESLIWKAKTRLCSRTSHHRTC